MREIVFHAVAQGWCRAALVCCGIGAGMSLSDSAHAAPPQQLLGKSIILTWNESRIQRTVGQTEFRSVQASHIMAFYVGTSGRVFSRLTNTRFRDSPAIPRGFALGSRSSAGIR